MNTALRLAEGEVLYRDVGFSYGPLPPLVDGFLLRTLGRSLDVLVAWRTVLALLGVEALRRLARRLVPGESLAAAICSFAIAACAFGVGGSWPFPYSVAALAGTVGMWWAVELALASESLAGSTGRRCRRGPRGGDQARVSASRSRRPRSRSRAEAPAQGSHSGGSPGGGGGRDRVRRSLLAFGIDVMRRQGFLIALDVPESWRRVYESRAFRRDERADFALGGFRGSLSLGARGRALLFSSDAGKDRPSPSAALLRGRRTHILLVRQRVAARASAARGVRGDRRHRAGCDRVEAWRLVR